MADDGPPLLRPIPRRPFDLSLTSPTPPDENSSPATPAPAQSVDLNNPRFLQPTPEPVSLSRPQSFLNLTSSTLFGIYSPTASNSRDRIFADRDELDTPWGTGAQTPIKRPSIDEATYELLRDRSHPVRRRSSFRPVEAPGPLVPAPSPASLALRGLVLFVLGVGYGVLVTTRPDSLKSLRGNMIRPAYNWAHLAFWGFAGVALGALLPWLDRVWEESFGDDGEEAVAENDGASTKDDGPSTDWALVVRAIGAFVGIVFAIRKVACPSPSSDLERAHKHHHLSFFPPSPLPPSPSPPFLAQLLRYPFSLLSLPSSHLFPGQVRSGSLSCFFSTSRRRPRSRPPPPSPTVAAHASDDDDDAFTSLPIMNKLANMRHWSERMTPNFGMGRPNPNMPMNALNHPKNAAQPGQPIASPQAADATIHYSFNVPFASDLAGPDTEDILHATTDAVLRWTHPEDAPDDVQIHELPVHGQNLNNLRRLCRDLSNGPLPIEAHVLSTTPKNGKGQQVTTVCLSGSPELVHKSRETILNDTPISLRCTTIDVDGQLVCDLNAGVLKKPVTDTLDYISSYCGVDIFLLGPKLTPVVDGMTGDSELRMDQRWRVAIYGDILSSEHAKARVLIHIDTLLGRIVDGTKLELSCHQLVCGRHRKNIKLIESSTGTAIYFPPPFSQMYRYCPPNATRRDPSDVFITGETPQAIELAKQKLHETVQRIRLYVKDVTIPAAKIDSILLGRLDKVRKILEANGTYIMFPPLASQRNMVRVQGSEGLHVERTVREIMSLAGQFYSAGWYMQHPEARQLPNPADIRAMLVDICANSDADLSFDKLNFAITGSDDAVKSALEVISDIKFVAQAQYQIRVKIELANEHKEFVSGKKNGKINKIMGQSNVQIIFDGFNEYNFNIDVMAASYDSMKQGLTLVEQEMPASISFHVPDQYHKRIIGIGGQHIQRIMKKHSVFVKFSNAMDRGGMGREDDDIKVDNVICRTPARNAQNLDAVKNEILEMVDRADSEYTSQIVSVDRLYHRQLIARLPEIDELEQKYNCKINFPSTEQASDEVTVNGPQWQVPHCVDEFLGMVPDKHELVLARSPELIKFLESPEFAHDLVPKLKSQHEVELTIHQNPDELAEDGSPTVTLLWGFTRNNAGGLRDAMDFIQSQFATSGAEVNIVKGALPRPKSDSFEDSLQYFDSKLLQHAPAPVATDSPVKAGFGDDVARERSSILDRLRKPGSMTSISSFLDRRKNSSHSANNFFKGSSNVSKSSLISIESTRSFNADRNPWNDSGVNLPDDDNPWAPRPYSTHIDNKLSIPQPGDITPRHSTRASGDSGRPSTSHSMNSGYPAPIGPFR